MTPYDKFLAGAYAYGSATDVLDDGTIVVSCWPIDLPGCIVSGATQADALKNLTDFLPAYLESLQAIGREIPEPSTPLIVKPGAIQWLDSVSGIATSIAAADLPRQALHGAPNFEMTFA